MPVIEPGHHYTAGDFGADWMSETTGWFILNLDTGNAVCTVTTVEELLRDFPEFEHAEEVA